MQPIYLVCGVPGSGKTWVCKQLAGKFTYIPHDEHYEDLPAAFANSAKGANPVLTECPFGERPLRDELELIHKLKVIPYFIVMPPEIVAQQYLQRSGRPLPKASYTRATTIVNRAIEWAAFAGTSFEVLRALQEI